MKAFTSKVISTATTTSVYAGGNWFLHTLVIPKTTLGAITFEDTAGSPNTYFILPASTVAGSYRFDSVFPSGLQVVTASADNIIINSSQE